MGRVIEHATGGDEGNADARGEIGERGDAGTIVAAIRVPRREIERRSAPERLLDAPGAPLRNFLCHARDGGHPVTPDLRYREIGGYWIARSSRAMTMEMWE